MEIYVYHGLSSILSCVCDVCMFDMLVKSELVLVEQIYTKINSKSGQR